MNRPILHAAHKPFTQALTPPSPEMRALLARPAQKVLKSMPIDTRLTLRVKERTGENAMHCHHIKRSGFVIGALTAFFPATPHPAPGLVIEAGGVMVVKLIEGQLVHEFRVSRWDEKK